MSKLTDDLRSHDYSMPHNVITGECPPNCPANMKGTRTMRGQRDTAETEPTEKYYVLFCRECDGDGEPMPMPFESAQARGRWAAEHTAGTGHDLWVVIDQFRNEVSRRRSAP